MSAELMAVYSPGPTIHLYLKGYKPGRKPRSVTPTALCGATVAVSWGPGHTPTGRMHVPFAQAVEVESTVARHDLFPYHDPRPRRWCPLCLGRAIAEYDLIDGILTVLVSAVARKEQP